MTREQRYARTAIAHLEGDLTERWENGNLVLQTFDGRIYRVDRNASRICRTDSHSQQVRWTDLCELETQVSDPMWFGTPEPYDDSLYEDAYAREDLRVVTDWHEDRHAELRAERKRIRDDQDYYRRLERAA